MKLKKLLTGATLALGLVMGGAASAATIVNLGFAIDHSGSVSAGDFTLQQQGLANALAQIPTNNPNVQYRVAVVTFGADVKTLVNPTLVTSAADISTIQTAITSHNRSNTGATWTGTAINTLSSLFTDKDDTLTLFNISTDGSPNGGASPQTASNNAFAAGVDAISFELVGSFGQTQINNMLNLAGPDAVYVTDAGDLPNATEKGFVFAVNNFADYEAAIGAKIQRIVDDTGGGVGVVPLPAGMPLMLSVIGIFAFVRRKRAAA